MKHIIFMAFFAMSTIMLCSQSIKKSFTIGDTFPPAYSKSLFTKTGLSTGKPTIITFWSPACGSAIGDLEALQKLMNNFDKELNFIAVTSEKEDTLMNRLKKSHSKLPALSYIFSDTILAKNFPHSVLGHTVWIRGDGLIEFITRREQLTSKNISDFKNKRLHALPFKQDVLDFNRSKPIWKEGGGRYSNLIQSYSYFMSEIIGIPGITFGFRRDSSSRLFGIKVINYPLANYFEMICAKSLSKSILGPDDFIWSVDQSDSMLLRTKFCYESSIANKSKQELLAKLSDDLKVTFKLEWVRTKENKIEIKRAKDTSF